MAGPSPAMTGTAGFIQGGSVTAGRWDSRNVGVFGSLNRWVQGNNHSGNEECNKS